MNAPTRRRRFLVGTAWLLAFVVAGAVPQASAQSAEPQPTKTQVTKPQSTKPTPGEPAPAPVKVVKMYAENWKWTPKTIRVARGTHVRIEVENVDAPHRFHLKEYKLDVPLPQGETTVVEFVADKVGEFRWNCSRPCGNGCPKMTGTLTVE